jgi:hypothetical protein
VIVQSMRYDTAPKDPGANAPKRQVCHGDRYAWASRAVLERMHAERSRRLRATADAILAQRSVGR